METVHLAQPSSTGKVKFITMTLDGATVTRTWGLIGHKTQSTSDTKQALNVGKANEKSPEQVAREDFDRIKTEKCKEGYRVVESLEAGKTEAKLDEFDIDNPPSSFAPAKPIKEISDEAVNKLIEEGRASFHRKENGLRHFVFVGTDPKDIRIYTRRMDDHTRKYPHLVKAVLDQRIPSRSVLDVELVVDPRRQYRSHTEAFQLMQGISKKNCQGGKLKPDLSECFELQRVNPVRAMVFNLLFWNGLWTWKSPYGTAYGLICKTFGMCSSGQAFFQPTTFDFKSAAHMDEWIRANKRTTEGVVIWDLHGVAEVCFTGKPKRKACYKRKAMQEADVIVTGYEEGSGKHQGRIGALKLAQLDSKGVMHDIGLCGGGLSDEQREIAKWTFPCVIQVEFTERFDKTQKMQFPQFVSHTDKTVEEADPFPEEE